MKIYKSAWLALVLVVVLLLAGCGGSAIATNTPTVSVTPTETPTPTENSGYNVEINRITPDNWAMFGSMSIEYAKGVDVNRQTAGYQPFFIINRMNEATEQLQIGTGDREETADIPIKKLLHDGELASVIGLESSLPADKLVAIGYSAEANTLTITGFLPSVTRRVTIRYKCDTVFRATLYNDRNTYREWEGTVVTKDKGESRIVIDDMMDNDVASIVSIESNTSNDKPVCMVTDNKSEFLVSGLEVNTTRTLTIKYKTQVFRLLPYFRLEKERITVGPDSFEPLDYSFNIPESAEVPDRFTVYINVQPVSLTGAQMEFIISYNVSIKVSMR